MSLWSSLVDLSTPAVRMLLLPFLLLLGACASQENLPAILSADRVVVGQFKSTRIAGELTENNRVAQLLQFANAQRHKSWSNFQFIHGKCNLLLTFMSGSEPVGYIGVSDTSFFTHSLAGQVNRLAAPQEVQSLFALIPETVLPEIYRNAECKAV